MEHIDKPWGYEEILETNGNYTLKRLFMKPGESCSLQYHVKKRETIYVVQGKLHVQLSYLGEDLRSHILYPNDTLTILPTVVHRMTGVVGGCLYLEASTSELDDVVRLEDNYGRV